MAESFRCDGDILNTVKNDVNTLRQELKDTLTSAQNVMEEIRESEQWKGRQKDAMVAFLDLTTQYHGAIVGGNKEGNRSPMDEMCTAMEDFCKAVESFYEEYQEYKEIKKIQ